MIQLIIIGHIGKDATVTDFNGKKIINFSVAHSEKYKNAENVEITKTTWAECAIWKNQNESLAIANYLKKGGKVFVQGMPEVSVYTNKENKAVPKLAIKVSKVELLGEASNTQQQPEPVAHAPANSQPTEHSTTDANGQPLPF